SLKLAGHTDNTGSRELNLRLSKERAEAVKNYLVSKGANPSRIEATGYGPDQPIASNATAAGRQQNRRVEFTLY
ncbi:OmpA family protein, partial [Parapusillimonas sp. SGNA-6]|nr:OmpA family protein [Parapusillimonas sp. SGNA-6]